MRPNESKFMIAACTLLAALIILTGCAGSAPATTVAPTATVPPPTPIPSATPDLALKTFHSERYGYSVTYSTKEWVVTETEGEWPADTMFEGWWPGTDTFSGKKSSDVIVIAAQPIPAGITLEQKYDALMELMAPYIINCDPPIEMEPITVGGEPTLVTAINNCQESENMILVFIIHKGKNFGVYTRSTSGDQSDDWPNLKALLSTWTFTE